MSDINFTIISLPYKSAGEQSPAAQFQKLQGSLGPVGSALRHFMIPSLKVGTLDSLMEASDELAKVDPMIEGACTKLASVLEEASGQPRHVITSLKLGRDAKPLQAEMFLKEFSWFSAQYDTKDTVMNLIKALTQAVTGAEERSRKQIAEYSDLKNAVANASRRTTGSWAVKPIGEAVRSWCKQWGATQPLDSEFLTTIFVAVPNSQQADFLKEYRSFHSFVVPRSSSVVASDKETTLNSIICFKKVAEDVKLACRKNKYNVRDYEAEDAADSVDYDTLKRQLKDQRDQLVQQLTNQFTQCFVAWIHAKAIRVFVESMLKYGLPPKFVPVLIACDEKKEQEIRKHLNDLYPEYANPFQEDKDSHFVDISALQQDYPYVSLKVTNIAHKK